MFLEHQKFQFINFIFQSEHGIRIGFAGLIANLQIYHGLRAPQPGEDNKDDKKAALEQDSCIDWIAMLW